MKDWLGKTRRIQQEIYGRDFTVISDDDHRAFLIEMFTASVKELGEAMDETQWKSWAVKDGPVVTDRVAFVRELVDAAMFIANMAISVGCTDDEWDELYKAKWKVNIERQQRAGGYLSRKGVDKCTLCGRSFDDVGQAGGSSFCVKCVGTAVTG